MPRKSHKNARAYLVYKTLRCTMDAKDVAELMKFNPNFRELTEDDNYKTLYEAIYQICVAMNYTFESDMNSDSLEKIPERKY